MRKLFVISLLLGLYAFASEGREVTLTSPDGANVVKIETDGGVRYSVAHNGKTVVEPSPVSMTVDGRNWGNDRKCNRIVRGSVDKDVKVPVPRRFSTLKDTHNGLTLKYKGYDIEFRAYNDGVAYRFISTSPEMNGVEAEGVQINLSGNPRTYTQLTDRLQQWFEYNYTERNYDSLPTDSLIILPMLADYGDCKVLVAEANVYDYPGMYMRKNAGGLAGVFAQCPASEVEVENGNKRYADEREGVLSSKGGRRAMPWRVVGIHDNEADILASELIYLLADDAEADYSWVRPGKVLWDWWNCRNIYGVDFEVGINTDTYKYMIDYAAKHGIEYLLIDEGWSAPFDLLTLADGVDMPEICRYAEQKGVDIILWTKWVNLDRQMTEALDMMSAWGVKGVKVDFMDRNDAKMVGFYERTASEAAKRRMLVNFHGSYPPDGMRRKYPDIMTREGVYGLENNKWSDRVTPRHDVLLGYIRQYSGPMDYTPGAVLNAHPDRFRPIHDEPMSQGTRSHQAALYVVFESPLQTLADSPYNYDLYPESRDFFKVIPTVWDETVPLAGKLGEYVAVARRSGEKWYVGVLNGTDATLHLDLDLSFLGDSYDNVHYHADGPNAARQAKDCIVADRKLDSKTLSIDMSRNGGYAAIITSGK